MTNMTGGGARLVEAAPRGDTAAVEAPIARGARGTRAQLIDAALAGKTTNEYDLGGPVDRPQEFEPEFREIEEKARANRRAVSRPGYRRRRSAAGREPA